MIDLHTPLDSLAPPPYDVLHTRPAMPNIKELFLPDPGFLLCDADLEQADAQTVAWEADDEILKAIFRDPDLDLHTENAKMIFGQCPSKSHPNRKKAKAGCFPGYVQVLTPEGWVPFSELPPTSLVAQWNEGKVEFVEPLAHIKHESYEEDLYEFQQKNLHIHLTDNHRCATFNTLNGKWTSPRADSLPKGGQYRFETAGHYHEGKIGNPLLLCLLAAVQADGHINTNAIRFDFRKERKALRLESFLKALKIKYTLTRGTRDNYCFYLPRTDGLVESLVEILGPSKEFDSWLFDFDHQSLECFIQELAHWDGWMHRDAVVYSTTNRNNVEWVQTVAHLVGRRANFVVRERDNPEHKPCFQLHITERSQISIHLRKTETFKISDPVYCVQVPSGSILVKMADKILMTRNCHAVNFNVKGPTLAKTLGILVKEADSFIRRWFDIHPGILEWHERTFSYMTQRGWIENAFGNRQYFLGDTSHPTALAEALAWVPQSTTGLIINRAWLAMDAHPDIQILMQVHDSLVFQIRKTLFEKTAPFIHSSMHVEVPYSDPMTIGSSIDISPDSWGNIKGISWDGYWLDKEGQPTTERCPYFTD